MKFSDVPIGATFKPANDAGYGDEQWTRSSRRFAEKHDTAGWEPSQEMPVELVANRTSTRCRFDALDEGELFTFSKCPGAVYKCDEPVGVNVDTYKVRLFARGDMVDTLVEREHNVGLSADYWRIHDSYRRALDTRDVGLLRKEIGPMPRLIADLIDRITKLENELKYERSENRDTLQRLSDNLRQLIKDITS